MTRHVHRFRQSWINTYLKCPEQARRLLAGEVEPTCHTDSTALGTAVHAGIEQAIEQGDGGPDAIEYTLDSLEWRYTKYSRDKVYELAHQAYETWVRDIAHLARPKSTEESFSVLLYEDRWREIHLTGTADCIDYGGFVWDWKTASRAYRRVGVPAVHWKGKSTCKVYGSKRSSIDLLGLPHKIIRN